jgi:hypothetical protein
METNQFTLTTYNLKLITFFSLELSSLISLINCSSGFTLLLRHKADAQNLQRGIRFNPAAGEMKECYLTIT